MQRNIWNVAKRVGIALPVLCLSATPGKQAGITTIDVQLNNPGPPISDLIYGANDLQSQPNHSELSYPLIRLGGNTASRYNWRKNAWNTGKDWFFLNVPLPYGPPLNDGGEALSYSDQLLLRQGHKAVILTIPTLGWVAKERTPAWGYSVLKYGKQKQTEHDQSKGDAGNGELPSGKPLETGEPRDTSVVAGPEFMADWVRHNQALIHDQAPTTVFYAMDNEPSLWHITHQDLRYGERKLASPKAGYDEIWQRTVAYASAVKKADKNAKILGPVEWGWCGYLGAGRDGCSKGADVAAHGNLPFLQWYLRQACAYQKQTGTRLVDYLDVHYYPASEGGNLDESPGEQLKRLAAPRSLYDHDFKDGSWIDEPIRLIPRLKEWIAAECPGTGIALTEYHFGENAGGISAAMANGEALAIFGKEGLAMANYFGVLPKDSLLETAFRLYLDYDGQGSSALGGQSLPVRSSRQVDLPAYGIKTGDKVLIYVFNKTEQDQTVKVAPLAGWHLGRRFALTKTSGLAEIVGGAETSGQKLPGRSVLLQEWVK